MQNQRLYRNLFLKRLGTVPVVCRAALQAQYLLVFRYGGGQLRVVFQFLLQQARLRLSSLNQPGNKGLATGGLGRLESPVPATGIDQMDHMNELYQGRYRLNGSFCEEGKVLYPIPSHGFHQH